MTNQMVSRSVRQLIYDTGLPLKDSAQILGITPSEFMKWWRGDEWELSYSHLRRLCQYFYVDDNDVITGCYDRGALRRRLWESPTALPERYHTSAYSHVRSSAHIIEYLRLTRGQHFCDAILKRLNINPLIFDDLDNKINLLFFKDLLDVLLHEQGYSQKDLEFLGATLFLTLQNTPLGEKFSQQNSYFGVYQVLFEHIHLFDENFIYESKLTEDSFTIVSYLNYDHIGDLNIEERSLKTLLCYKQNMFAWFPYLAGLSPLPIENKKCITQGDPCIVQTLHFPHNRPKKLQLL